MNMRALIDLLEADYYEENIFMEGYCHALALAIHAQAGYPIVIVWSEDIDELVPAHVMNRVGDEMFLDARGVQSYDSIGDGYSWDFGEYRDSSPREIQELIQRGALAPIPAGVQKQAALLAASLLREVQS